MKFKPESCYHPSRLLIKRVTVSQDQGSPKFGLHWCSMGVSRISWIQNPFIHSLQHGISRHLRHGLFLYNSSKNYTNHSSWRLLERSHMTGAFLVGPSRTFTLLWSPLRRTSFSFMTWNTTEHMIETVKLVTNMQWFFPFCMSVPGWNAHVGLPILGDSQ